MKNSSKLAIAAITLWVLTIVVFGYKFVTGSTELAEDNRQAITITPSEKIVVLGEMRGMLLTVQGILEGLEDNNMDAVSQAALASGTEHMVDTDPRLMLKLPLAFKKLGVGSHTYFDEISAKAKSGTSKETIIKMLNTQLKSCVACHATYQLKTE